MSILVLDLRLPNAAVNRAPEREARGNPAAQLLGALVERHVMRHLLPLASDCLLSTQSRHLRWRDQEVFLT